MAPSIAATLMTTPVVVSGGRTSVRDLGGILIPVHDTGLDTEGSSTSLRRQISTVVCNQASPFAPVMKGSASDSTSSFDQIG